jgi:hypothetical protein
MMFEKPEYAYPIYEIDRLHAPGREAGIYYLDGSCRIAAHGGHAELALLQLGAILVATLRFGPEPFERGHAGRVVERLPTVTSRDLLAIAEN